MGVFGGWSRLCLLLCSVSLGDTLTVRWCVSALCGFLSAARGRCSVSRYLFGMLHIFSFSLFLSTVVLYFHFRVGFFWGAQVRSGVVASVKQPPGRGDSAANCTPSAPSASSFNACVLSPSGPLPVRETRRHRRRESAESTPHTRAQCASLECIAWPISPHAAHPPGSLQR
jgi:hypothetical protein